MQKFSANHSFHIHIHVNHINHMRQLLCRSMATLATAAGSSTAPPRVAVIGGGIAGLSAAQALQRHNVPAALLDMGRSGGGRVASRAVESEIGAVSYDHGAQFFTARSPEFQRKVAELQAAGVVAEWTGRHARITADGSCQLIAQTRSTSSSGGAGFCGSLDGLPLYVGTPTNSALCHHLGQQLAQQQGVIVEQGVKVQAVERLGGGCGTSGSRWRLRGTRQGRGAADAGTDGQEDLGAYDAVVLADGMTLLPGQLIDFPEVCQDVFRSNSACCRVCSQRVVAASRPIGRLKCASCWEHAPAACCTYTHCSSLPACDQPPVVSTLTLLHHLPACCLTAHTH